MGKPKKKDNHEKDVRIDLFSNSSTGVTGSCYKVSFMGKTYLVDCGSYQEKDMSKNYYQNLEMINKIKKQEDLLGVFLTHSHV